MRWRSKFLKGAAVAEVLEVVEAVVERRIASVAFARAEVAFGVGVQVHLSAIHEGRLTPLLTSPR